MLKRLFRDSVLYTLSTVMTRGISFILLPVYTQTLTPEEFGLLDYFVALGAIASILVTLEVIQAMARFVPERSIDPILKREYASTCLWFTVATHSAMLVLVTSMSTDLASWLLSSPQRAGLIDLAAWSYWVTGIVNVVHGQLRFELRAATSALLSLLSALLTVACTVIFVVWLQWGVRGALLAQVIGGILSLLPGGYLTRASFSLRFSSSVLRQALAYSVPLIPSSLAVVLTSYFDRIALKQLMGLSEVGIYAVGQKISLVVALALIGFRSALTPLIYANHEHASTPGDLAKVFRIFCVVALSLTAFLSVFAAEIVSLISSDSYQEAARVVPLQAFAVLMANVYIFAPGLDIKRKTAFIALINIGVVFLNILLNYTLIPLMGMLGAALSAIFAFSIGFVAYMTASQKLYPVPHQWGRFVLMLFVLAGCLGGLHAAMLTWHVGITVKVALLLSLVYMLMWAGDIPWSSFSPVLFRGRRL